MPPAAAAVNRPITTITVPQITQTTKKWQLYLYIFTNTHPQNPLLSPKHNSQPCRLSGPQSATFIWNNFMQLKVRRFAKFGDSLVGKDDSQKEWHAS